MESSEIIQTTQKYFKSCTTMYTRNTKVYKIEPWFSDDEKSIYPFCLNGKMDKRNILYSILLHWKLKGFEVTVDDMIRMLWYTRNSYSDLEITHELQYDKVYLTGRIDDLLRRGGNIRIYIDLSDGSFAITEHGTDPSRKVYKLTDECCYFDPDETGAHKGKMESFEKLSSGFHGIFKYVCGMLFYMVTKYITGDNNHDDNWIDKELKTCMEFLDADAGSGRLKFFLTYRPTASSREKVCPSLTYARTLDEIAKLNDGDV